MKRVLLAALLCAPLSVWAESTNTDPFTEGSVEAGAATAAVCAACHGQGGNSANPQWPKLAGQGSRYIYEQLQQFKSGARVNALMAGQVAALSDEDMRNLAAYFAAQPASPGVASEAAVPVAESLYRGGDSARGIPACSGCHTPNGAGVEASAYPRVGGQHSVYVASRLKAYRDAAGTGEGNFAIMAGVASKLTDAEIEALASYVNGLQ